MKKSTTKRAAPRISDRAADWYAATFGNLNAGAEYIMEATPKLYAMTIDSGIRGKFSRNELMLMLDAMNGHVYNPQYAGSELGMNVANGMALDALDRKWGITDHWGLNRKIADLSPWERACLETWVRAFWQQESHDNIEPYVAELT